MRQFLALALSDPLREELAGLQRRLRERLAGWRWATIDGIHLTLRFLGNVPPDLDSSTRGAWREVAAAASPLELAVRGIGTFPPRGRPRVLWAGVRELSPPGRLAALAGSLESAARGEGFEPEPRPFRPHLTLARAARSGRAASPPSAEFDGRVTLVVDRLVLFRSELRPTGARYSVLENYGLGGG